MHYVAIFGKLDSDDLNIKAFDERAVIRMPYDNYFIIHAHRPYERAAKKIEQTLELLVESEAHRAKLPDERPSFYGVTVLRHPDSGGPFTCTTLSVPRGEEVPIQANSYIRVVGAARNPEEAAAMATEGIKKTVSIMRSRWQDLSFQRQPFMEEFSTEIQLLFP